MWLGISLLTCNIGFIAIFVLAYWLYYERIMYAEEQFLRNKFGVAYINWAEITPTILPNFKSFSLFHEKVLRKKKVSSPYVLSSWDLTASRYGKK
ncbi:MAG: hypothetical protein V8R91_21190 [Butyricimonas faecihominis]